MRRFCAALFSVVLVGSGASASNSFTIEAQGVFQYGGFAGHFGLTPSDDIQVYAHLDYDNSTSNPYTSYVQNGVTRSISYWDSLEVQIGAVNFTLDASVYGQVYFANDGKVTSGGQLLYEYDVMQVLNKDPSVYITPNIKMKWLAFNYYGTTDTIDSVSPTEFTEENFGYPNYLEGHTRGEIDFEYYDDQGNFAGSSRLFLYGTTLREGIFSFPEFEGVPGEVPDVPGVPEPATWLMMLAGFGMAGMAALGRRRKQNIAVFGA